MAGRWNNSNKKPPRRATKEPPGVTPSLVEPQLGTLVNRPPTDGEWSYEIKFDGYRILARIDAGDVQLFTRNGHDWSDRMPKLCAALKALPVDNVWLDGEAVVLDAAGMPNFNALQNAFDRRSTAEIVLFFFDLLYLNGTDLREQSLRARRALLAELLGEVHTDALRYSEDFAQDPDSLVTSACKMKLEGIIGKRADAPYRSGRSTDWVKLKCKLRQEFVVAGFTRLRGANTGIRALLLGVYEMDGTLRFAGTAQQNLRPSQIAALEKKAKTLVRKTSACYNPPAPEKDRDYVWLEPRLVAELSFLEWTPNGEVRHPMFHGMRDDKPAAAVTEEPVVDVANGEPVEAQTGSTRVQPGRRNNVTLSGQKISNADRVIDPVTGMKKIDLVRYYDEIAEWALPYLQDRPVSLVRAPDGIAGELFFQKHEERMRIPGITKLPVALHPKHPSLLAVDVPEALIGLAQMNVIELHTWNAVQPDLQHPDRFVLDLDPDPSLSWKMMTEAAQLAKVLLDEVGLKSFIKTSGGKGYHIVIPLTRRQSWDEVKTFSQGVARHMAQVMPDRFSAVLGPKNRVGKIFIDYLRNSKGASTVAAFSARARSGMGVSMPIAWEELPEIEAADQWTIHSAIKRQRILGADPWQGYARCRQGLTVAMKRAIDLK
ncbi:ATP dependent DNA ligase [Caballeronia sordidicola]|uniref:DNA ligase (ATP) n=1 Tax=Caballeronia sordidicola TaxID=196367 RepID=A0A158HPM6_CABSO|nr:DNA ligase D [Caballeronia sordidicola]SAL45640.1 ATP dependent DNA ligase [Caballeronia sordidicola]